MTFDSLDRPRDNEKPLSPAQLEDISTSLESALKDAELRKNIIALFNSLDSSLKDKRSAEGGFKEIFGRYLESQKNALSQITEPTERLKIQQATTKHLLDTTIWYADKKGDANLRASAIDLINQYTNATEQVKDTTGQKTEALKADLDQFGEKYSGIRGLPEGTEARKWTVQYSDKSKREIVRIVDTKNSNILHTIPLSSDGGLMGDQNEHTYIISGAGYKLSGKAGDFEMKEVSKNNKPNKQSSTPPTAMKPSEKLQDTFKPFNLSQLTAEDKGLLSKYNITISSSRGNTHILKGDGTFQYISSSGESTEPKEFNQDEHITLDNASGKMVIKEAKNQLIITINNQDKSTDKIFIQQPRTAQSTDTIKEKSILDTIAQGEFRHLGLTTEKRPDGKINIVVPDGKSYQASINDGPTLAIGKGSNQLTIDSTDTLNYDTNRKLFVLTNKDGGKQTLRITEIPSTQEKPKVKRGPEALSIQGDLYDIGVQVFEKLRKPGESISFSPTSLKQILYIYTLSHGNEDLAKKLGFSGDDKTKFEELLKTLNSKEATPFKSVNAIFSKLGSFGNEKLMKDLRVELGKINPNDINGETARLNKFVSDQTNGMIKDIFKENDVRSAQEIFVNTMYFKGDWESKFDEKRTMKDQPFGNKKADLMVQTSKYEGIKTSTSRAIKMPFKDGSSMIAFLPDNNLSATINEANKLLKNPNSIKFGEKSKVQLTFPKFETESMAEGIGAKLGIDIDVMQKSKVIVNEIGAEAAAASAALTRGFSVDPELKFDKPFYYAIQDKAGNVHFMGTYEGK